MEMTVHSLKSPLLFWLKAPIESSDLPLQVALPGLPGGLVAGASAVSRRFMRSDALRLGL